MIYPLPIVPHPAAPTTREAREADETVAHFPQAAVPPIADALPPGGADLRSDRERIVDAMERAGWVKAKAARILGLTPRQIGYALRKHNIRVKKF